MARLNLNSSTALISLACASQMATYQKAQRSQMNSRRRSMSTAVTLPGYPQQEQLARITHPKRLKALDDALMH